MTKLELYRAGMYSMPVPGPCPTSWGEQDWINFIDSHGRWHKEPEHAQA